MFSGYAPKWAGAFLLALVCCDAANAATLATGSLFAPLAPGNDSRLSISMPPEFSADQELWIAYELVALDPADDGEGEVDFEQSFEGVKTPPSAFFATIKAKDMPTRFPAGEIAQQLEQLAGLRDPEELKRLMGTELHLAWRDATAGKGRVLGGRLLHRLPAPGTADTRLLISVERATGIQPLAVKVTVGQGSLPSHLQERPQDSTAWKIGYGLGVMLFGWLVMRWVRRRRD
jgi:hypothetical protein